MFQYLMWDDSYSSGINKFDEDHKKEFDLINRFIDSVKEDKEEVICRTLKELVDHLDSHFAEEERVMEQYEFPALKEHRDEHDVITARTGELHQQCVKGEISKIGETLKMVSFYFLTHLKNQDISYGPFLLEKGFQPE